jgi:hypothetical protein
MQGALPIFSLLVGAAVALLHYTNPIDLVAGLALITAGAVLTLRGKRPIVAARALQLLLVGIVTVTALRWALAIIIEMRVGQGLAEDLSVESAARNVAGLATIERVAQLAIGAAATAVLVIAAAGRLRK